MENSNTLREKKIINEVAEKLLNQRICYHCDQKLETAYGDTFYYNQHRIWNKRDRQAEERIICRKCNHLNYRVVSLKPGDFCCFENKHYKLILKRWDGREWKTVT